MRDKTLIRVVLSALICLLAAGVFWYMADSIRQMDADALKEKESILVAEHKFAQARSFARLYTETGSARSEAGGLLISEGDVASFIAEVEALAERSKVSFEVGSVDLRQKEGVIGEFSLTARFGGNFSAAYHFLSLMETLPYALEIEQTTLEKGGVNENLWTGTLAMKVFTRRTDD